MAIWISWPGVHGGVISVSFRIVAAILKFKTEAFTDCCHTNALYGDNKLPETNVVALSTRLVMTTSLAHALNEHFLGKQMREIARALIAQKGDTHLC